MSSEIRPVAVFPKPQRTAAPGEQVPLAPPPRSGEPMGRPSSFDAPANRVSSVRTEAAGSLRKPSATEVWNLTACNAVAQTKTVPPTASRIYAMLSAAQYSAAKAVASASPEEQQIAVAAASAHLLAAFFESPAGGGKGQKGTFASGTMGAQLREFLSQVPRQSLTDERISGAAQLGREAAAAVLARDDGFAHASAPNPDMPFEKPVPNEKGAWFSSESPPLPGLLPNWGKLRPWHMPAAGEAGFPKLKTFAFDGAPFKEQLREVVAFSRIRAQDPECVELKIARFWADNPGTPTPPGHWNEIAREHIAKAGLSELEAARVLFYMNSAVADAGIACWDQKYEHRLLRPSQANPEITVPEDIGLPNFPAYPSGHASFSAAAAEVLKNFFPGGTSVVP